MRIIDVSVRMILRLKLPEYLSKASMGKILTIDIALRYNSHKQWICQVTYDHQHLQIEDNDGKHTLFSEKHSVILEVITYYHEQYDSGEEEIKKPLILGIEDHKGAGYTWYENTGNGIIWRNIGGTDRFPKDNPGQGGNELIDKLNKVACTLHNLHFVNIYKTSSYNCVCREYNVTVSDGDTSIPGYTKYNYKYTSNENSVRYQSTVLEWKSDKDGQPLTLDSKDTSTLTVYYWDADKDRERKKPLLIEVVIEGEVFVGGMTMDLKGIPISLGNDGYKDNKQWTMTGIGPVTEEQLHKQRCQLFSPVEINVAEKEPYDNPYCTTDTKGEICNNEEHTSEVEVTNCNNSLYEELISYKYSAWKHTYGKDSRFTIMKFTGGPDLDKEELPIWDVTKVVVFFPECSTKKTVAETPLAVYVESGNGNIHRWSTSEDNGGKWEKKTLNVVKQQESRTDEVEEPLLPEKEEDGAQEVNSEQKNLKSTDSDLEPPKRKPPVSKLPQRTAGSSLQANTSTHDLNQDGGPYSGEREADNGAKAPEPLATVGRPDKNGLPGPKKATVDNTDSGGKAGRGLGGGPQTSSPRSGYPSWSWDWNSFASTLKGFYGKAVEPIIELKSTLDSLPSQVGIEVTKAALELTKGLLAGDPGSPTASTTGGDRDLTQGAGGSTAPVPPPEALLAAIQQQSTDSTPEATPTTDSNTLLPAEPQARKDFQGPTTDIKTIIAA